MRPLRGPSAALLACVLLGAPACGIIAGLGEHSPFPIDAGPEKDAAGGAGSGGMGGGGGGGMSGGDAGKAPAGFPDSMTATCSNGKAIIACPTKGQPYFGQDGNYTITAPSYTPDPAQEIITDNITGLTWWGTALTGKTRDEAAAFCKTIAKGGFQDFRLPTRIELVSLLDFGATGARIDQKSFPNVVPGVYWTRTRLDMIGAVDTNYITVDLGCTSCGTNEGGTHGRDIGSPANALCVRGAYAPGPLARNDQTGVIEDEGTGLTWTAEPSTKGLTWLQALEYCQSNPFAGLSGWRLPNIKELQTLVEDTGTGIEVSKLFSFKGPSSVWSSSASSDHPERIFYLTIPDAYTAYDNQDVGYFFALCVRAGKGAP